MISTGFEHVLSQLVVPAGLSALVSDWQDARGRDDPWLIPYVTQFRHEAISRIKPYQVKQVCLTYALGDLTPQDAHPVVADAHIPWTIEYLFHDYVERERTLPSWDVFRDYIRSGERRFEWWVPLGKLALAAGLTPRRAERAMLWRLAHCWQSCMRELHFLATLHHKHGLPVRYHMFADVALQVDAWVGNQLIQVFVRSPYFERKRDPRLVFPGFDVHQVEVPHQGHGVVWFVPERRIDDLFYDVLDQAAEPIALIA